MEFFTKATNFPFMSTRKLWYGLSVVLILVAIGSFFVRGLNLAVDFTGGVQVQAGFSNAVNIDALRSGLERAGFREEQVQYLGSSREAAIRLPTQANQSSEAIRARVEGVLHAIDPRAEVTSLDVVGSQVGAELKSGAVVALAATLFLIFGYIALIFHTWRLSLGAILAVLHDPILVLGAFSLWHTSFDLPVVSAMLAVIGYSLNDTVVVFDRIRERFEGSRRLEPVAVLDQSINQTLSRTIMTKVVTLIVVVALYLLGGQALKGFSEALIIGILAGTYSSIYISSAIALDCGLKAEHLLPTAIKKPVDDLP
ncbi:MAG TPA: protein translocase subunit SecF [Steroidobacteraceae bacterium]|nr:protein translocase subunit SecF [Steroidobacteraceae bacterium]